MEASIIGVDPSSKTGVSVLEELMVFAFLQKDDCASILLILFQIGDQIAILCGLQSENFTFVAFRLIVHAALQTILLFDWEITSK